MKKKYFFVITFLIIIIDQIIKKNIITYMKKGEIRNFLGQVVKLNYVTNTGGAFSIRRKSEDNNNFIK